MPTCCMILVTSLAGSEWINLPELSYSVRNLVSTAPSFSASMPMRFRMPLLLGARCTAAPSSLAKRDCSRICGPKV